MNSDKERIVRLENEFEHIDEKLKNLDKDMQTVMGINGAVSALHGLTVELRRDTDSNTKAIDGLTKTLSGLTGAVKQAGWVIGGGTATATALITSVWWLHSSGIITVGIK